MDAERLKKRWDFDERLKSIVGWKLLMKKFGDYILGPSPSSRMSKLVLRSRENINAERRRQLKYNRFIIHPFSRFKALWNLVMVILTFFSLVIVPYRAAYVTEKMETPDVWFISGHVLDFMFSIDILVTFRTGYWRDDDMIVISNKKIAQNYLKTWFFIDIISVLPMDEIYGWVTITEVVVDDDMVFAYTARYLNLFNGFRIFRLFRNMRSFQRYFWPESIFHKLFRQILLMFLYVHWNACIQYIICYVCHQDDLSIVWIGVEGLDRFDVSAFEKYTRSMLRVVSQMYGVDIGSTSPVAIDELWVGIVSYVASITLYVTWTGMMIDVINSLDAAADDYTALLGELKEFMRFNRVPVDVQQKVLLIFAQKYRREYFSESKFLQSSLLSPPIREDLNMHMCRLLLHHITLFTNAPRDFLVDLVSRLEYQVYLKGDLIVKAGQRNVGIHFIASGSVVTINPTSGAVVETLQEGSYFGAMAVLFNEAQLFDVLAEDDCDMFLLGQRDFDRVIVEFPEFENLLYSKISSRRMSGSYE